MRLLFPAALVAYAACDILVPLEPGAAYRVRWAHDGTTVHRAPDGELVFRGPDPPLRARMVGTGALMLTVPCTGTKHGKVGRARRARRESPPAGQPAGQLN